MTIDYRAYPVLYVDDERANLATLTYAFEHELSIQTTSSPTAALKLLRDHPIAVLVTDQQVSGVDGADLCEEAAAVRPDAIRILLTAYSGMPAAIDAMNRGRVTRYVSKPYKNEDLLEILRTAIELVHIQRTVRGMESRLLRAGPAASAPVISDDMAHELKNVVQPAVSDLSLARKLLEKASEAVPDTQEDCLRLLKESTDLHVHVAGTLRGVIEMIDRVRLQPPPRPPIRCDVARVVDSTLRIVRHELENVAHLQVTLDDAPEVAMDSAALGQVVLHLLLDAAQAIQESSAPGAIHVSVAMRDDVAAIGVSARGPDVAQRVRNRIHEALFSTTKQGSGVRLAVVRRLVRENDGAIELHSQKPDEATVLVRLPLLASR